MVDNIPKIETKIKNEVEKKKEKKRESKTRESNYTVKTYTFIFYNKRIKHDFFSM